VVDDEPQIQRFLKPALIAAGYRLIQADRGNEALRLAATKSPDAILLDLGLPDMHGQIVLQELRKFTNVPIIIISASNRESEKVIALDGGADDYVEKPFGVGELLARLRSALRHRVHPEGVDEYIKFGPLIVDTVARRVTFDGAILPLTKHEHALILLLIRNAGDILTHDRILTEVWGADHAGDVTYLRVYIGRLRQKLGAKFATSIITEIGIGYRLLDPTGNAAES
jgi:two-component system, OmpR family, KDP operon response regulator KdpE